ncbi:MAG: ATP-binding protein [Thermoprotei archaeon ex4572_64]|nr:MAG: ATP-binding protein [Thermoprotei archaeon ex4572_64]
MEREDRVRVTIKKPEHVIDELRKNIEENTKHIKAKFAIISGKGGVGKSFVSVSLAVGFALRGYRVGVLDADIYGPTVAKLLGLAGSVIQLDQTVDRIIPVIGPAGIKVISMDFLLPSEETPVIWRGPLVGRAIAEFLAKVFWGSLDVLIVDLPPGTGDAPLTIAQMLPNITGSIIVTTPSDVSARIVKKAIIFSQKMNVPTVGIIENMSYFICPKCNEKYFIFGREIGRALAEEMNIPYLGGIPLDPRISECNDLGIPFLLKYPDIEASKAVMSIVDKLREHFKNILEQE